MPDRYRRLNNKMKTIFIILQHCIYPAVVIGQLFSPRESYIQLGETLTVFSELGVVLRDSCSKTSGKLLSIPFGSKIIARDICDRSLDIQDRKGFWILTQFGNKTGYVFSGFLTRLKIPKLNLADNECDNLSWFEDIARFNADSLIYKGSKRYNGIDTTDEKSGNYTRWEYYKDETCITHYSLYEALLGVIESTEFTMNDVLNIWDYYLGQLKTKCDLEIYMGGYYKDLKLKCSRDDFYNVIKVECPEIDFTAAKIAHKLIISYPIYGKSQDFNEIRR